MSFALCSVNLRSLKDSCEVSIRELKVRGHTPERGLGNAWNTNEKTYKTHAAVAVGIQKGAINSRKGWEVFSDTEGQVKLGLSWKEEMGSPGRQVQWDVEAGGGIPSRGECDRKGNALSLTFGI